jgi:hypothetical protein
MSNKKKKSIKEVSNHKKAEVLGTKEKKKKILPYAVLSVCAVLAVGAFMIFGGKGFTSQNQTLSESKNAGEAQAVTHRHKPL